MRSLLLSRFSRICLYKPPAFLRPCGARFLSETPLCYIFGAKHCGSTPRDGDIGRLVIKTLSADPFSIVSLEKTVPMDLVTENGTIGASHGWVATLKDGVVCLQDDLNPSASDLEPKRISLPPLTTLPHCQTQLVTNIAMSSSSPEDEDCILAVKFFGPQLSLCRPAQKDPEWFNIRIEDPGFFSSRVMYSWTDKMFSMPASGGTYTGSWDLGEYRHKPKLQTWHFQNLPECEQTEWGKLNLCSTTEQLVESRPSGDIFLVKRFREGNNFNGGRMEEKKIMVFKLDKKYGHALYTEDIGDLSIFVSNSEPFCLQTSLYGKCQNSVYFIDNNESGIFFIEYKSKLSGFNPYHVPYFIPPQSYLNANRSDSLCKVHD